MPNLLPTPEARAAYYKRLVENLIKENEGNFVFVTLRDFRDGLRELATAQEQLAYCKKWVAVYIPGTVNV